MMIKAIIPILKEFKQQINNTNDRLTSARSFCLHLGGVLFLISFAIVPEVSISLVMH